MCHALAKMPDTVERDELLNDFADVARKTVVADVEAIKRAGKKRRSIERQAEPRNRTLANPVNPKAH
jgi:hypothetical protein